MHRHTNVCMDMQLPRDLVYAYADMGIHAYVFLCIQVSICTQMHAYELVCICTCISALGRGGEQPKNLTPPLGGGRWP